MLSKKQYGLTLLASVIVFFVFFIGTSFYFSRSNPVESNREEALALQHSQKESNEEASAKKEPEQQVIMPQTKITIKVFDTATHKEEKITMNPLSLLGDSRETLQKKFDAYTIETFNEKEVCLSKKIESVKPVLKDADYVLGVDGAYVCIKEKDSKARPIRLDYKVQHVSSYIYSLLLNEEISITPKQKEALLLNVGSLQKILQDYVGE